MNALATNAILGLIQGITEWFPISSSGHLALFEYILGFKSQLAYDLFLHLASLIVMIIYFRGDIARLARSVFSRAEDTDKQMVGKIIMATAVTVVIALGIAPFEDRMRALYWLAAGFAANALLLFFIKGKNGDHEISWSTAALLGAAQGLAVIPALSRSGITIALALFLGVRRAEAFRFSFLIAIPAIAGALTLELRHLAWEPVYLIGFVVAGLSGYATLAVLKKIVTRDGFYRFWAYNAALACIVLIYATRV